MSGRENISAKTLILVLKRDIGAEQVHVLTDSSIFPGLCPSPGGM